MFGHFRLFSDCSLRVRLHMAPTVVDWFTRRNGIGKQGRNVTWWPGLKTKFRGNFIVGWYLPAVKTGTKCLLDNYFWKENL